MGFLFNTGDFEMTIKEILWLIANSAMIIAMGAMAYWWWKNTNFFKPY